jgi:DNA-binding beta-propeller fold protein YncE
VNNNFFLLGAVFLFLAAPLRADDLKFKHTLSLYLGGEGIGMSRPEGVACEGDNAVLVADTGNNRLLRYTIEQGNVQTVQVIAAADMASPTRARRNSQGEVFVLDGRQHRLFQLSPQGEPRGFLELKGAAAGAAPVMRSFAIGADDTIYLLDVASERVLIVDPTGNFQRAVLFPPEHGFFSDIAVDKRGMIFLVDSTNAGVYTASRQGEKFEPLVLGLREKAQIGFPVAIAVDGKDRICLTDRNNGALVMLGRDGTFLGRHLGRGWAEGLLRYPQQSCITEKGVIFVADGGNSRVQMFEPVSSDAP